LSQEQQVGLDEPLGEAGVGRASPANRDDVIGSVPVVSQPMNER
jgi:hypothetical protein